MITPLQITVAAFAVFALSRVIMRWRETEITTTEFIFWSVVWGSITLIVFQPWLTDWISQKFGISRGIEFVVYISMVVVLYLIFRIYVRLEVLEQEITKIVSALALQTPQKKKK